MEVLTEAPKTTSFIPLVEHQSVTPESFYSGPPVLHYYSDRCKLIVLEHELSNAPALANLVSNSSASDQTSSGTQHTNGNGNGAGQAERTVEDIDIWVTSDKLFLYSNSTSTGLSIPYPTISLHAIQSLPAESSSSSTPTTPTSQAVYMQLIPDQSSQHQTQSGEDIDIDTISLTIIPTASTAPALVEANPDDTTLGVETEDTPEQTPAISLFTALSNCSNLHPDPDDDEENDQQQMLGSGGAFEGSELYQSGMLMPGAGNGGLPPAMPGSGGWITAENMHEYFNEQGEFIGPDSMTTGDNGDDEMQDGTETALLGPGAGTVRRRGEDGAADGDDDENDGVDGDGSERIDGDDAKWRRTG